MRSFLRAVARDDCEKAWTYFSRATQDEIAKESEREIRGAPYYADSFAPKNLYCKPTYAHRYNSCVPESAKLQASGEERAVVEVMLREGTGFLIPGFFPTSYVDTPVTMRLVRENAAWKIDRTRADVPREEKAPIVAPRDPPAEDPTDLAELPPAPPRADLSGNLIENGGFDGLPPWLEYRQSNVPDRAFARSEAGFVLWERTLSRRDGGLVGVYQDVDVDASTYRELELCLDVRVDYHTLGNTGWWSEQHGGGGEIPAKVVITYEDRAGVSREWEHGFMVTNEPETSIRTIDLVPAKEWRRFCFDLMNDEGRRDPRGKAVLPKPVRLRRIHLVGSGWDFRAAMANVLLRGKS